MFLKLGFIGLLFLLGSCAQNMQIPLEKLGENPATLTVSSEGLSGYVSVPLINHKVVNVDLLEFPGCENGELKSQKGYELGESAFTPKKNIQTFQIPAGIDLLVKANSEENVGGNRSFCHYALRFVPEKNREYKFDFDPMASFGSKKCSGALYEIDAKGNEQPVNSVKYPDVVKNRWGLGGHLVWCQ